MTMTDTGSAGDAGRPGGQPETSVKDLAGAAVQAVKAETATFAATAQEKISEKVGEKTSAATQTLGDFATAIRKAGEDLAQNDQSMAGRVVKQAADGLESLTHSLSDKRPEELLDAVRDFGRKNPGAFIAGSVLLGVALARLGKSSERRGGEATSGYRNPTDYLRTTPEAETFAGAGDIPGGAPPYRSGSEG